MDEDFLRDFFCLPRREKPQTIALRDLFASRAFAAIIGTLNGPVAAEERAGDFDRYAKSAYAMADALLRARK